MAFLTVGVSFASYPITADCIHFFGRVYKASGVRFHIYEPFLLITL